MARDFDEYWLKRVRLNASMSTCMRRQVGAVAVRDRRSFADAFNGNLPGAKHCDEGGCEGCSTPHDPGFPKVQCVCVHAEQNLVGYCAREGISMRNCTVYCTTMPCSECAKLLIAAGVLCIVYEDDYPTLHTTSGPGIIIRRFGAGTSR